MKKSSSTPRASESNGPAEANADSAAAQPPHREAAQDHDLVKSDAKKKTGKRNIKVVLMGARSCEQN